VFGQQHGFEDPNREDVFDYISGRGLVDYGEARRDPNIDEEMFGPHVATLKRNGLIQNVEGRHRVTFDGGPGEEFSEDGVDYTIRQAREDDLTGPVGAIRSVIVDRTYIVAESIADVVDHKEILLRRDSVESRIFLVATVNDDVVGWVHLDGQ